MQRIFRRTPKANALIEVTNLLSEASEVTAVTYNDISEVAARYGVYVQRRFRSQLSELYAAYLRHCLRDHAFSESDLAELNHLKLLFALSDRDIEEIHNAVATAVYRKSVDVAVADGRLDDEERQCLAKLESDLRLSPSVTEKIYAEAANLHLQTFLDEAVADERLAPDEEQELEAIARSFGVTLDTDKPTDRVLARYRLYWLIENGELPIVDVGVNLQKNEQCDFTSEAEWYEYRTVTKRIRYAGPTARIRLARGVYWRMGDLSVQAVTEEHFALKDSGTIFVTDKRLILQGSRRNATSRLSSLINWEPFQNGIKIDKTSGKPQFYLFDNGGDVMNLMLERLTSA